MINIFYDELIKEASLGRVYTYYKCTNEKNQTYCKKNP